MTKATITLPDDLAARVRDEAERRRTSFSAVIRELVTKAFGKAKERPREIPFANIFDDPTMVPAERIDEALAESWPDAIDRDRG